MKTKPSAILLVILCTFLTATAQMFWKKGSSTLQFNLLSIITNYNIFIGFFLYGIAAIMLILALKNGELSVLYPFVATSFIWVSLLAMFVLNENMSTLKWFGIISIIFGVSFIGFGAKHTIDDKEDTTEEKESAITA